MQTYLRTTQSTEMQSETDHLSRLAENTSRYARSSRSAGGLTLVIGGVLCLAAFVLGAADDTGSAARRARVCRYEELFSDWSSDVCSSVRARAGPEPLLLSGSLTKRLDIYGL